MHTSFRIPVLALLAAPALLAAAPKADMNAANPFFNAWKTPFGVPPFGQIKPEHFMPAFQEGMKRQKQEIEAIVKNPAAPSFANTIAALDDSGEFLARVERVFLLLTSADTNEKLQALEEKIQPMLTAHRDDLNLDEALFQRVKAVYAKKDKLKLDSAEATLLEKAYRRFTRGGANVAPAQKERFRAINAELTTLQTRFVANLLKDTNAYKLVIDKREDLAGLPADQVQAAAEAAKKAGLEGKWVFTLSYPSIWPFMTYAENRELRRQIFTAYTTRCVKGDTENLGVYSRIAALRAEKAQILGFKTWAEFTLDDTMAKTPEKAYALLEQLWKPSVAMAKREAADLQAMIDREKGGFSTEQERSATGAERRPEGGAPGMARNKLEPWDWWYYADKVKKAKYDLDEETMKPYFPLDQVRQGAFALAGKLYGVTFTERKDLPVYHKEAKAFEVKEKGGQHLGVLYMDFHPRPGKTVGAWCDTLRDPWIKNGTFVSPIVYNVCNFARPSGDAPALLSADEAETLFHEFGHAIHNLLVHVRFRSAGVNGVAIDFVELPSQVMENWVFEPEMLKLYARHYKTGQAIPADLVQKKLKAANFNMGFAWTEKLAASLLDLDWHSLRATAPQDALAFEKASFEKWGLIPEIVSRYRTSYFKHSATDYSASYYSYTWSEVLDSDAFQAFKEKGNLFDPATAKAFRKLLSKGASEDPAKLYREFRGRDPKVDALLEKRDLK